MEFEEYFKDYILRKNKINLYMYNIHRFILFFTSLMFNFIFVGMVIKENLFYLDIFYYVIFVLLLFFNILIINITKTFCYKD